MKTNFPAVSGVGSHLMPDTEAGVSHSPRPPLRAHPLDMLLPSRALPQAPAREDSPEPAVSWGSDMSGTDAKPRDAKEVQSRQTKNARRVMEGELTRRLSQVRLAEDRYRPFGLLPPELARQSVEAQDVGDGELVARASMAGSKRRAEGEAAQPLAMASPSSSGKRSRGSAPNRSLGVSPHQGEDLLGTSAPW